MGDERIAALEAKFEAHKGTTEAALARIEDILAELVKKMSFGEGFIKNLSVTGVLLVGLAGGLAWLIEYFQNK